MLKTNKNTFYIGQTNNLEKRLKLHRTGKGAKYLRMFDGFKLVYAEKYDTRSGALKREIELKKLNKEQKRQLVEEAKPYSA